VTVSIQPGKIEEAVGLCRDVGAAVVKKQQGFKAVYYLRGSDPNKLVVVGLWETKANSEAWQNSEDYQEWRGKLSGVVAGPPAVEVYEVVVQA
jgi:heme-degrading monooxygenase HmoA